MVAKPTNRGWSFYGRQKELDQIHDVLVRQRWFFLQISGRRRIGKTALIQQALSRAGIDKTLYIQIPDSDPSGVVAVSNGYLETFGLADRIDSLAGLAQLVGRLARDGYVVALDEFQYFNQNKLFDFCSLLQAEVDRLSAEAANVQGGLIVSGSIHTEMTALLEDREAPLFNRTTDVLQLDHLDIASVREILLAHADDSPERLLFLWNLFEGVPKFYRDAFEQGVLASDRRELLERLFFNSSSPLCNEADNWFLRELRGRYDTVLQYIASHPGSKNADIEAALNTTPDGAGGQIASYLQTLSKRYRMIERRLPIFSGKRARSGRYYIRDNFLRSWLSALQRPASAVAFRPLPVLLDQADQRLAEIEGYALEDLAAQLYEERSRAGVGDFALTERIDGYWDRGDVEIDLVAVNETEQRLRLVSCKRNAEKLPGSIDALDRSAQRFLKSHRRFACWTIEYVGIAPRIDDNVRAKLEAMAVIPQSLGELIADL